MSYYRQENRKRLSIGQDGNALTMLIAINLIVFVLLAFIQVIYFFTYGGDGKAIFRQDILKWVTLPGEMGQFLRRPWTLFTHMFSHEQVWHIIANMLWLWAFGYIFQDLTGNKKVVPLFIYGGLAGAAAFMLAFNFIPALQTRLAGSYALGASAGVTKSNL